MASATGNGRIHLTDVHTHHFPDSLLRALERRTAPPQVQSGPDGPRVRYGDENGYALTDEMSDIDAKLAEMDRAGVDRSVLSVSMPGVDGLGKDAVAVAREVNDGLRLAASRAADRLAWMAVLPMDCPDEVSAEMTRCVSNGACGVMIGSNVNGRLLDLDTDSGLFHAAQKLDVPIMIHPVLPLAAATVSEYQLTSILGFLFDTTTVTLRLVLAGMFDRFPDLKVVVSHVGGLLPFIIGRIDYQSMNRPGGMGRLTVPPREHLRKLYVDSVCLWPPALRLGVEFFGADHMMFGTDTPHWPMESSVETLRAAGLPASAERLVGHGTAAALLQLG